MDDSTDPLRGGGGYVDPSVGDLVVVAQHGERLAGEVVDGGFTLQGKGRRPRELIWRGMQA